MKNLNAITAEILGAILRIGTGRIDNSGGKHLAIHVGTEEAGGHHRIIFLAHYTIIGERRLRNPEVQILHDTESGKFIPFLYRNDITGIETRSIRIDGGQITETDTKLQEDHADFTALWLFSIARQQGLVTAIDENTIALI